MNAHTALDDYESLSPILAEQALLGAIMVNNEAYFRVADFLEPWHFAEPLHSRIFSAVSELIQSKRTANPVLLKQKINVEETIGDVTVGEYLARLAAEAVTVINAFDYGAAIYDSWKARSAVSVVKDFDDHMAKSAIDLTKIDEALDELTESLSEIRHQRSEPAQVSSYLDSIDPSKKHDPVAGVPIWSSALRSVLSEDTFEAGNLYGLLASSGEGKTSFILQVMFHALTHSHPVLFLSYDQNRIQCIRQINQQVNQVDAIRQKRREISQDEFEMCAAMERQLNEMMFEVVKCTDERIERLINIARNFCKRAARRTDKTPLIVIDHIRAIPKKDERADAGSKAASVNRPAKSAAEELGAAIIMLNQRNSQGVNRKNPTPTRADLFGGEQAREDYDAVAYLYRELKWYQERKKVAATGGDFKDLERVFSAAVRDGEDIATLGSIKVRFGDDNIREKLEFVGRFTRFQELYGSQSALL